MPNFITKNIKDLEFPYKKNEVEFFWVAYGRNLNLILTKCNGEYFFIAFKKKGDFFVVKGEKLTKPSKIGLLQKGLEVFADEFCTDVISRSFAVNKNSLIDQTDIICDENEIIKKIKKQKFQKIFIEIGFGSGRHILYQAKNNNDILVIGIEIYKPAIEQVAKLAIKDGLTNLFLVNTDARVLLSMIKSNSIDKIFLHFPVPWDDAPHRRVVSDEFVKETQRVLKENAKFELRSDSREYSDYTLFKFMDADDFEISVYKNKDLKISSKYEDRWKRQEKDVYDIIATNFKISDKLEKKYTLGFLNLNPVKIYKNFKNETYKFDGYFVHFEEKYKINDEKILLKVSFGAFDLPQHCYIKITFEKSGYFIKHPLQTKENFKAHEKIKELLERWQK